MIAYFADGSTVRTESESTLPLGQQILENQHALNALKAQINRLTRLGAPHSDRKMAQAMQSDFDTLTAKTKLLMKRFESEF